MRRVNQSLMISLKKKSLTFNAIEFPKNSKNKLNYIKILSEITLTLIYKQYSNAFMINKLKKKRKRSQNQSQLRQIKKSNK
jgi:hypothetical protein